MSEIIIHKTQATAQQYIEDLGNGIELEMVLIPQGTFTMGAPKNEEGSGDDERPQHQVTVPTFFIGRYQVTQAQWRAVANFDKVNRDLELEPSRFKGDNSDMHGNVWEWCLDDWHDSYEGAPTDGSAWVESENENDNRLSVLRGGSWYNGSENCCSANRNYYPSDYDNYNVGLRVVCAIGNLE